MTEQTPLDYEPGVLRVFQSKAETKAYYDKIAQVYDLLAESSEQPMREVGLQMLAVKPGETILEIGFGTGHSVVELAEAVGPSGHVLGVDLSEKMTEQARKLVQDKQLQDRVELQSCDAAQFPFDSDSIDGIFTSFTLELFDTPELPKALQEWIRVLRPGGRLVVVSLSKEGKQGAIMKAYEWTHKHFPNLMDCRPIFVERALQAAGYVIADKKTEHMWVAVEIVQAEKQS